MYVQINERGLKFTYEMSVLDAKAEFSIQTRREIIEDFIEEEGDFVTEKVSGWFESNLNMLAGKELDGVG